jgi:hypothetical protein
MIRKNTFAIPPVCHVSEALAREKPAHPADEIPAYPPGAEAVVSPEPREDPAAMPTSELHLPRIDLNQ